MTERKNAEAAAIIINFLVFVLTAYSVATFFVSGGEGNMEVVGAKCFMYFTVDSNILAAAASLLSGIFGVIMLKKGTGRPGWLLWLDLAGTSAVMLTFLTVMCFLGPTMGYAAMFEGVNLLLHLVNPLLSVAAFAIVGSELRLKPGSFWAGVVPTVIYGAVYFTEVIIIGGWTDFYGFNRGGMWYISIFAMLAASALISLGVAALRNGVQKIMQMIIMKEKNS